MSSFKKLLAAGAVALTVGAVASATSDAAIFYRGPVRRVAARAVLPPYPVARRAAFGPVYRPYAYRGGFYGGYGYGGGVAVGPVRVWW